MKLSKKLGGDIICACDPAYPLALAALEGAPPVITVLGNTELLNKSCIAMVGSRNASLNGRKFAEKMSRELGQADQIVISGLARGIDTSAHIGALESGTIAVVAGGIDVVYPQENQSLYEEIKEKGLIVAENALGQKPFAQSFPQRNRIVSGISSGVVIVEANMRSGSLITARLAGEQGRDVYAVPGHPMDPRAKGTNALLRDGAVLIRGAEDIIEHIHNFSGHGLEDYPTPAFTTSNPFETANNNDEAPSEKVRQTIIDNLSYTPSGVDELLRSCQLNIGMVQSVLLELEIAGRIERLPGNRISLTEKE